MPPLPTIDGHARVAAPEINALIEGNPGLAHQRAEAIRGGNTALLLELTLPGVRL